MMCTHPFTLSRRRTHELQQARGFTLIELLVVIGIIVVIVGMLTPMAMRSWRNADRTRMRADLNTIATALDAYRADHGDYPRPGPTDDSDYRGAHLLCKALLGPAPAGGGVPPDITPLGSDGAGGDVPDVAGYGFRTRRQPHSTDTSVWQPVGKVYGPYLDPAKFPIAFLDGTSTPGNVTTDGWTKVVMVDKDKNPILYFAARSTKPNINVATPAGPGYVGYYNTPPINSASMYNFFDNLGDSPGPAPAVKLFARASGNQAVHLIRMRMMLGDICGPAGNGVPDGIITNGQETAAHTGPYLLWAAGADGYYGPLPDDDGAKLNNAAMTPTERRREARDCDDVTNFNVGQ